MVRLTITGSKPREADRSHSDNPFHNRNPGAGIHSFESRQGSAAIFVSGVS